MNFLDRFTTGWEMTRSSLAVLKKNKKLILFPIISGASLLFILASFVVALLATKGWDYKGLNIQRGNPDYYLFLFCYYVITYFLVVFFNIALIHCARLYFRGEEPTIRKGINFSLSRIGVIFTWAIVAATVGTILKTIQDKAGFLGKILIGLVGITWSISTFFVLPVLAYEEVGPIKAVKRSAELMKQKWGESLGATFSFGLIQLLAIIAVLIPLFIIGIYISVPLAFILGFLFVLVTSIIMGAAKTIFIAAVYEGITHHPVAEFQSSSLDGLFVQK